MHLLQLRRLRSPVTSHLPRPEDAQPGGQRVARAGVEGRSGWTSAPTDEPSHRDAAQGWLCPQSPLRPAPGAGGLGGMGQGGPFHSPAACILAHGHQDVSVVTCHKESGPGQVEIGARGLKLVIFQ